jgi:hypothetical protein
MGQGPRPVAQEQPYSVGFLPTTAHPRIRLPLLDPGTALSQRSVRSPIYTCIYASMGASRGIRIP